MRKFITLMGGVFMMLAMNVQAVQVEKDATRPLMSGFHGMWSAGGIAGPAIVTGALWLSGSPLLATLAVSAVLALLLAIAAAAKKLLQNFFHHRNR